MRLPGHLRRSPTIHDRLLPKCHDGQARPSLPPVVIKLAHPLVWFVVPLRSSSFMYPRAFSLTGVSLVTAQFLCLRGGSHHALRFTQVDPNST